MTTRRVLPAIRKVMQKMLAATMSHDNVSYIIICKLMPSMSSEDIYQPQRGETVGKWTYTYSCKTIIFIMLYDLTDVAKRISPCGHVDSFLKLKQL